MDNTNQFSNMMNIVNLISSIAPKPSTVNTNTSRPMFPIDEEIHTEPLRICKCLIPYLPYERQKNLSVAIKLFELMSVVQYYSAPDANSSSMRNPRESETWQTDLLHAIRHNLDPNHAYLVDMFFKINDAKKILTAVQSGAYTPPTNFSPAIVPNNTSANNAAITNQATHNSPPSNGSSNSEVIQKLSPLLDDNQRKMLEMLSTIMK